MQESLSHPVHLTSTIGNFSPSSFIPFCAFDGNASTLGRTFLDSLSTEPACEAFNPKVRDGKLCYQVDIEKKNLKGIKNLEKGLVFAIDYNSQRSFDLTSILEGSDFYSSPINVSNSMELKVATIFIETLGKMHMSLTFAFKTGYIVRILSFFEFIKSIKSIKTYMHPITSTLETERGRFLQFVLCKRNS